MATTRTVFRPAALVPMSEGPHTLTELLVALRVSQGATVYPGEDDLVLPHRELPDRAAAMASRLRSAGVRPGDVVGLLVPTSSRWLPAFFGVAAAGAAVSALPMPPVAADPGVVADRLRPAVLAARMRHVVADGTGAAIGAELADRCPGLTVISANPAPSVADAADAIRPADPDGLAMVQFSSGSTARPKGVMLTHEALLAGVAAIRARIAVAADDVLVQWVPLFHDMGVVSLLCALLASVDAHLFSPVTFIRRPDTVLAYLARVGGTILSGPNFSYDKLASVAPDTFPPATGQDRPLARWRLALNGAEQVRPETVAAFARAFGPLGVAPSVMYPCYGLAEATLAVTLPRLGDVPRMVTVDRDHTRVGRPVPLLPANTPGGRTLVGVGRPVPGMAVRITDPTGPPLPPGWLGEIEIRGAAVTSGYLYDDPATTAASREGWLRTGDLGFYHDGELFLVGRTKELIVVKGRNLFPDDVEDVVRVVPGIYQGHVVAIADPETEWMIVVAESAAPTDEHDRLVRDIRATVSSVLGLADVRVLVVGPRGLPKTTSGKWQRSLVAEHVALVSAKDAKEQQNA